MSTGRRLAHVAGRRLYFLVTARLIMGCNILMKGFFMTNYLRLPLMSRSLHRRVRAGRSHYHQVREPLEQMESKLVPGKQVRAFREYDKKSGCVAARQTARALR